MVYRIVLVFGEVQAVETRCKTEHTFDYVVELKVRTEFLVIVRVLLVFQLVGIV